MTKIFSQLAIFYHVVINMSFSKAAQHLNCSKAYISKEINNLESCVGTLLLQRNTRYIKLTYAGEALFEHAKSIVHEVKAAESTITGLQSKVTGMLRITAPLAYTDCMLSPSLPQFLLKYPTITLEMIITSKLLNLVEENIDIAIRLTHEPPLERIAKRIGQYQMVVCASGDYLKKTGRPRKPNDLLDYHCLVYDAERNSNSWPFIVKQQAIKLHIKPKISANNCSLLLNAALNGLGIMRLPSYIVMDSIQSGRLVALLTTYYPPAIPIYAVYAQSRIIPPKIHAFIDFLKELHVGRETIEGKERVRNNLNI
jgi:DNA-binding transcriptional LysR family regulator